MSVEWVFRRWRRMEWTKLLAGAPPALERRTNATKLSNRSSGRVGYQELDTYIYTHSAHTHTTHRENRLGPNHKKPLPSPPPLRRPNLDRKKYGPFPNLLLATFSSQLVIVTKDRLLGEEEKTDVILEGIEKTFPLGHTRSTNYGMRHGVLSSDWERKWYSSGKNNKKSDDSDSATRSCTTKYTDFFFPSLSLGGTLECFQKKRKICLYKGPVGRSCLPRLCESPGCWWLTLDQ